MKKVLSIILLLSSFHAFAGGGWTKSKGKGYFKLSQWWIVADQHFTDTGDIDPNITNALYNTNLYGEYGITDAFDVMIYLPFFSRAVINESRTSSGVVQLEGDAINSIGDTDIGIKYGIIRNKKVVLSSYVWLGIPLGEEQGGVNGNLQTGDGEFNQRIGMDASTSWNSKGKWSWYATLGASYNFRSNDFSDQYRFDGEVGAVVDKKWILNYKLISLNSTFNGDKVSSEGGGLFVNDVEYLSFVMEAGYLFNDKIGVSATAEGAFFAKLIYASPGFSVGVFLNL